jgi:hypothetical protein
MISEIIQTVIAPIQAFFGHAERKLTVKIVGSVLKSATPKIKSFCFQIQNQGKGTFEALIYLLAASPFFVRRCFAFVGEVSLRSAPFSCVVLAYVGVTHTQQTFDVSTST